VSTQAARQNAAIDTVGRLQQQAEILRRRIDAIEGIPLPGDPPEPG
jgi:hypothetical protein